MKIATTFTGDSCFLKYRTIITITRATQRNPEELFSLTGFKAKPAAQLAMWRVHIHLQKMQWSSCHNVQKRLVDIQIPFVGLCLDVHRFMHAQNGKHVAGGPNKVLHPMS